MSTITATSVSGLTDEQVDFREAIRDFAKREVGTAEQREKLTDGYLELHNQEIYEKLAELGWLGVSIDEEYGGAGGGMVDALHLPRGDDARARPDRRLRRQPDRRRRLRALRHRGAEGGDARRHLQRPGRGDRDVRARGRLRRRQPQVQGRAAERRLRAERPEDLDQRRPHRRPRARRRPLRLVRLQARGPDDDLRPHRRRGDRDQRDPDDGRQGGQRRLPDRLPRRRRPRCSGRRAAAGCS